MQDQDDASPESAQTEAPTEGVESPTRPWQFMLDVLLHQAAALCVQNGVDIEAFMHGAWSAYVETRPGMRDQIEESQLRSQLDELRKFGRLGTA
jgi:hypothetical protein